MRLSVLRKTKGDTIMTNEDRGAEKERIETLLARPVPRGLIPGKELAARIHAAIEREAVAEFTAMAGMMKTTLMEAVGLLDAGQPARARALMEAQVTALDGFV
jgi:hypothetical protein